ncbi:MAG TPA: carboxymuconolactone decarboxylase family protein [Cyclobacteriaceae bacterium]|nr:carboxymuconolactone decarboxylase family protein [Cyclobacteriaceae bacterium]
METRVNIMEKGGNGLKALFGVGGYLKKSKVEHSLLELIAFRIAQINGCAYCLDMHAKEARAAGETEQRIYSLSSWREMSIYTDRERAALAWAEAVNGHDVPQDLFDEAKKHFSDEEIFDMTLSVGTSATWNKLNIALTPIKPGSYTVGQFS